MTKPFLTIAFLLVANLIATDVTAQQKKFSFGVEAGVNLSKASVHTDFILGKPHSKTGFQAGITTGYDLNRSFSLQSGLSLTTKGVQHKGGDLWIGSTNPPVTYYTTTTNQVYLQLPLKIAFQAPVSSQTKLFVNTGPYIAYGIGGKETTRETTKPSTVRGDEKFVTTTFETEQRRRGSYGLKRFDYGLSFGMGAVYEHYVLAAGYELGIPDIGEALTSAETFVPAYEYRNRNFYCTVGYRF